MILNLNLLFLLQCYLDVVCSFNCNKEGTVGGICESNTGHGICVCKDNWSGDLCDTCNDGWYKYDYDGWESWKNDKCLHGKLMKIGNTLN